jgi:hypothetical protein
MFREPVASTTPEGTHDDCFHQDSVRVYSINDARFETMNELCGKTLPLPIMSSGEALTLEFESHNSAQSLRGFRAMYSFVTGNNLLFDDKPPKNDKMSL